MDRRKTLTYACASQDLHIHTHSFLSESEVKGNTVDEAATLMFVLKKRWKTVGKFGSSLDWRSSVNF